VLTSGAQQGLSAPYLASITGVTEQAVQPYIELSFEARLEIDLAFAEKDVGDCSGFVTLVNQESTQPYFTTAELNGYFEDARRSLAIYNLLDDQNRLYQEKPKVGDLIFFANTVKRYAKAKKSIDNITHIGIITKIDPDDTVYFIHHTKGKNLISQMNLNYPTVAMYDNKVVNSYMEKCPKNEGYQCLAPAYFSAYGKIK
jgi:hypothetical protein